MCIRDSTKTADATFDVTYIWDLSKVGDQTYLELMPGQTFTVNYDVTAWVVDIIQTDAVVSGTITVYNNGGMTPYITSVEDSPVSYTHLTLPTIYSV